MKTMLDKDQVFCRQYMTKPGAFVPFARASALAPFISFLETIGAPTPHLLGKAQISSGELDDPEALLPILSIYRFIELASQQEKIQDLGALVGEQTSSFDLGAFGAALHSASTVNEYLRTGIRLIGALSSGERFWISEDADSIRVNQYLPGPASLGRCLADVYTLVITVSMLRRFIDKGWSPKEVRLMTGNENLIGDGRIFGNAEIVTGAPNSSFTLPHSLLQCARPQTNARKTAARSSSQALGYPIPIGFKASVEQLLVTMIGDQNPTIEVAAKIAGMSPRTLQRRLAGSGYTFTGLLAETRTGLAKDWLVASDAPVVEIAGSLGYSDPSNFIRAFRRITGMSPQCYRQSLLGRKKLKR
jgi:AraC-like DNA-binding protein